MLGRNKVFAASTNGMVSVENPTPKPKQNQQVERKSSVSSDRGDNPCDILFSILGAFCKWFVCCGSGANNNSPSEQKNNRVFWRRELNGAQTERTRDLSSSFCEHTWDLHRIIANFPDSNINIQQLARSGGLSKARAEALLLQNGLNILPPPKEMGNLELWIRQFWNLLWVLLIGAATLSLADFLLNTSDLVNLWITLIVFGMIVVMCTVSWFQEMNARRVVAGFQNLLPPDCIVIRNGKEMTEGAQQLVVGDLVKIKAGSRIPADCRILLANQLKLESSSITGEAEPHDYFADAVPSNCTLFEAYNIALNGSLCVDGEGLGLVIRTAGTTVIGQIAEMTTGQGPKKSRLQQQIRKYAVFLVFMAFSVGTFVFIIGGIVNRWHDIINLLAEGYLVCAIGMALCGLPATVTSMLSLIAKRLAHQNVYLKRLDICEALGQVSIIASDKTGTLTKNQMTVVGLWYHSKFVQGDPPKEPAVANPTPRSIDQFRSPVRNILQCMCIGITQDDDDEQFTQQTRPESKASIARGAGAAYAAGKISRAESRAEQRKNERKDTGTPSEMAMTRYAYNLVDTNKIGLNNLCFEVPFNSRRKWQLAIFRDQTSALDSDGRCLYRVLMKGASEILAQKCTSILDESGETIQYGQSEQEEFEHAYQTFASNGYRVIGFAETTFRAFPDEDFSLDAENFPTTGLTFIGVCAIVDPPRDETADAIRRCKEAGIRVFMVTGDHQLTATAIAKQIGLIEDQRALALANSLAGHGGSAPALLTHGTTASTISNPTNNAINPATDYEVIHGDRINKLTDADWDALVRKKSIVFARTTPEQKLMIVEQCQRRKLLIAMTGDGVNDAPALKKADIGIAMGSGSEVAKQAADIILMDDNFSSIVRAVKEGRVMYDNIKKLLGYTMPHAFPQVWPVIVNFCFGFPVGLTGLQILSVDLGTELLPGVSMAKEPGELDIMRRPPRPLDDVLVSNSLLAYSYLIVGQFEALASFLSYMCVFWTYGFTFSDLWMSSLTHWKKGGDVLTIASGRSFSVAEQLYIGRQACAAWQMGIVFSQFFHIWSARTRRVSLFRNNPFSNKFLLIALVVELALINLYVYCPGLNTFLGGAPIPWQCWAVVAVLGVWINIYNEIRKFFGRNYNNAIIRFLMW